MNRQILSYCLLMILLCFAKVLDAQPVTITGTAPFAKNQEIRLAVMNDLLNGIPQLVATDKIDRNGHFKLTYQTNDIQLVQLSIRTTKAEFFIVPHNAYEFQVSVDSALFGFVCPETFGGFLQIASSKTDTADLNYKLNRFSNYLDNAMDYFGFRLIYDKDATAYDSIQQLLKERFDIRYNPQNFYQTYLFYSCGMIDRMFMVKEPQFVYRQYFEDKDVLYNNPAYMSLFNACYTDYLYNSRYVSKDLLSRTINEDADFLGLFNETGRDPMLVNDRIRELVILKNLIALYDDEDFDRGNIIELLQYIKDNSRFPEHVLFAQNALSKLRPSENAKESPVFKNSKGKNIDFKQFEGKDIYVQLFQSDCMECIREMMILKELYGTYADKIQFVSLDLDMDKENYENFCETYAEMFPWPILHFNDQYDWLMENGIETLPDYMVMDQEGRIISRDLPAPGNGLAGFLQRIFPKEEQEDNNPLFRNKQ